MPSPSISDALVVGGGVIGLSIAESLARDGLDVTLLERGQPGREASWAGAGVLPPASWYVDHPLMDAWALAAAPLHAELSERLREQTGVDDQYTRCGAVYQATPDNAARLAATFARWERLGVAVESPSTLTPTDWRVADEAQVRNPRRLQALTAACRLRGVTIVPDAEVRGAHLDADRIVGVDTTGGRYAAGAYCFAAGCWTGRLAGSLGLRTPIRPIRGQMLLLRAPGVLDTVVHRYPHYAVPRRDGLVLVGATVEEAGFDKQTTATARQELLAAAAAIDARLASAPVEAAWSGLRPSTADGLPLVGRVPLIDNAWIATGHHRSGLQLAPTTAEVIAAGVTQRPALLSAQAFDPARFGATAAA